ncbi:MAG TPA: hypothetical protein VGO58_11030 [Chitinophagaceae bacterium]|jgi:hypothetical protein|nr:hypothetical protein [Chitinophagaceae bacterium]
MKRNLLIVLLFAGFSATAQQELSYEELLKPVNEVELTDSLHIDATPSQMNLLDSITVKKWFAPILGLAKNNRLKNRNYYLAGKITGNENFDLLVLLEEKKKTDSPQDSVSNSIQLVHLVSTRKDGHYIASIEAAAMGLKKRSTYNISSWLYKDYKIVLDSRISVNERSYDDMTSYRINQGGRFILSERWE